MEQHNDPQNTLYPASSYPDEEGSLVDTVTIKPSLGQKSSFYCQGINIPFPYEEAYPCQEHVMQEVNQNLNACTNCLLESPTGTGKTVALLCPLLAFQKRQETKLQSSPQKRIKSDTTLNTEQDPTQIPKIYYVTRTQKHIDQIIDQLSETIYSDTLMARLSSMESTCNNQSEAPKRADAPRPTPNIDTDEHFCLYDPARLLWLQRLMHQEDKTWKNPELIEFCFKNKTCPHFEQLNVLKEAKIVFCTYSYMLQPDIREALDINLKNNIIIFDEGHNVENICYQIASTPEGLLTYGNLSKCSFVLESALNSSTVSSGKKESLGILSKALQSFRNLLSKKYYIQQDFSRLNFSVPLKLTLNKFKADLESIGFGPSNFPHLRTSYNILNNRPYTPESTRCRFKINREALRFVADLLRILGFLWEDSPATSAEPDFNVFLIRSLSTRQIDENLAILPLDFNIEIRIMCMNPGVVFQHMNVARSVIIASGTLSPMKPFSTQLGIPFQRQLSECHVVDPKRVFCKLINKYEGSSQNLLELTSSVTEHKDKWEDIQDQLGKIVGEICSNVPKGVLVFVQSEAYANKMKNTWERNGNLKAIGDIKKIFFERKGMRPEDVKEMLDNYRHSAEKKGAILFAYMRGKFSEGIDFKDDHARALVIIGIPFLPKDDLFVKNKRTYQGNMFKRSTQSDCLDGMEWWVNNAFQALNQAIGRNIRHIHDWGAIFLLDKRWNYRRNQQRLPKWFRVTLTNSAEVLKGCTHTCSRTTPDD
ncbi:unnamed protein product [Allacma fusca]|uniref:Helicase ATP-binding domain-containing protein n=1 Tax=Allacma fusca TaxID=39272 RepID=A0A8J2PGP5_9HEXA|nr:unnamed protein product [Allacma fusca]